MYCSQAKIKLQQEDDREEVEQRRMEDRRRMGSVSNFIQRTYSLLQDPRSEGIIAWVERSERVCSFQVLNVRDFQTIVLPRYFKHSNLSSFIRQLNMYDFHKVRGDKHDLQFEHDKFRKGHPQLLCQIKRKQSQSASYISSQPFIHYDNNRNIEWMSPLRASKAEIQGEAGQRNTLNGDEIIEQSEDAIHRKLADLREVNKSRQKAKMAKIQLLNLINQQNKALVSTKFTKVIMSLFASKIKEETHGFPQLEYLNPPETKERMQINELIDHILDASDSLSFIEYSYSTDGLFATVDQ